MGLAQLTHDGSSYQFRTNPNAITWTYNLNKYVDETYGGRVVQLLSVNMDNLIVTADAGSGGWDHLYFTVKWFRDMLVNQRDSGLPGTFEYANRGWKFSVYALSMPMKDSWDAVRREFTMNFKIQEDVSGVASQSTMDAELTRLREGIGYSKTKYNDPTQSGDAVVTGDPASQATAPGTTTPAGSAPAAPTLPPAGGGRPNPIGGGLFG